jgi:hypothetical protein
MDKTLAQIAYEAYGDAVGWVNARGLPIPTWDQQRETIKHAWDAAVKAVLTEVR